MGDIRTHAVSIVLALMHLPYPLPQAQLAIDSIESWHPIAIESTSESDQRPRSLGRPRIGFCDCLQLLD